MILSIALIVAAYLLGSIPFGLLLTKLAGIGDIRTIGSGNIGATNVLRTGNKKLAVLTLLLDMVKGTFAVLLALQFAPDVADYAALAALLGHLFPVWLRFKGGKGVATALGVFIALSPPVAMASMLVWLAVAFLLRISSASALIAVGTSPLWLIIFGQPHYVWLSVIIIVLVFYKHEANIRRLIAGTEPKIGKKKHNEETNTHGN